MSQLLRPQRSPSGSLPSGSLFWSALSASSDKPPYPPPVIRPPSIFKPFSLWTAHLRSRDLCFSSLVSLLQLHAQRVYFGVCAAAVVILMLKDQGSFMFTTRYYRLRFFLFLDQYPCPGFSVSVLLSSAWRERERKGKGGGCYWEGAKFIWWAMTSTWCAFFHAEEFSFNDSPMSKMCVKAFYCR